jgi:hypothetical protein
VRERLNFSSITNPEYLNSSFVLIKEDNTTLDTQDITSSMVEGTKD